MANSYYSTVVEQTADEVWGAVREFDHYQWADRELSAVMEGGKAGDAVGGIRRVESGGQPIRQRLLAHSDLERFYTYEFCDPVPFPVHGYIATLRVTPVVDGDRAFVAWSATFDCDEHERWTTHFNDGFARWLRSLRSQLER